MLIIMYYNHVTIESDQQITTFLSNNMGSLTYDNMCDDYDAHGADPHPCSNYAKSNDPVAELKTKAFFDCIDDVKNHAMQNSSR